MGSSGPSSRRPPRATTPQSRKSFRTTLPSTRTTTLTILPSSAPTTLPTLVLRRRSTDVVYDHGNDQDDAAYDDATAINIPGLEEGIYDVGSDDARTAE